MITSAEYFSKKMALLKECLHISEEFMSSLQEWENLEEILNRRQEIILKLQGLEEATEDHVLASCTEDQLAQMNHILNIILGLDQDAVKSLQSEQNQTVGTLKANVQGQKISGYASEAGQRGRLLDFKE